MRKKGYSAEIKVGIFVLLVIVLLAYMSLRIGKIKVSKKGAYEVYALFDNVSGLVKNAPVEVAGVEIGRVGDIELSGKKAKVSLFIRKDVKLPKDSVAKIRTKGVLGDKFVEIEPGSKKSFLCEGCSLEKTKSPVELDEILTEVGPAVDDIRSMTKTLASIFTEKEKGEFRNLLSNLAEATKYIRSVAQKIDKGEGTIGKLVNDKTLYNQLKVAVSNLSEIAKKINSGKGALGKLVNDKTLYEDLKATLADLKDVSRKINKGEGTLGMLVNDKTLYVQAKSAIKNLNAIAKKINSGKGTLGKLVNDESLYNEVKKTLKNVNKATEGVSEQSPITVLGVVAGAAMR